MIGHAGGENRAASASGARAAAPKKEPRQQSEAAGAKRGRRRANAQRVRQARSGEVPAGEAGPPAPCGRAHTHGNGRPQGLGGRAPVRRGLEETGRNRRELSLTTRFPRNRFTGDQKKFWSANVARRPATARRSGPRAGRLPFTPQGPVPAQLRGPGAAPMVARAVRAHVLRDRDEPLQAGPQRRPPRARP